MSAASCRVVAKTLTREGGEGANSSLQSTVLHAGQPPELPGSRLLLLGSVACRPRPIVVRQHFVSHPASVYTLATTKTLLGYFRCAAAPIPCSRCISTRWTTCNTGPLFFESVLNLLARSLLRLKRPGPHVTNHSIPRFGFNRESERQRDSIAAPLSAIHHLVALSLKRFRHAPSQEGTHASSVPPPADQYEDDQKDGYHQVIDALTAQCNQVDALDPEPGRVMGHARLTQDAAGKKESLKHIPARHLLSTCFVHCVVRTNFHNVPPSRPGPLRRSTHAGAHAAGIVA